MIHNQKTGQVMKLTQRQPKIVEVTQNFKVVIAMTKDKRVNMLPLNNKNLRKEREL